MWKVSILALLLAVPEIAQAMASVIAPKASPCPTGTTFVRDYVDGFPSDWTVIVFCDRAAFEKAEKDWQAPTNIGGFTILVSKRTYILYDIRKPAHALWENVIDVLNHELKHVLCNCDLGEH